MLIKKRISLLLKILIVATSIGGVLLSLFTAQTDGYSHWGRRLLYFTTQSNLWIGFSTLALLLFPLTKGSEKWKKRLYILQYVFTASIAMTGVVYGFLLAPFAADYGYRTWPLSGLLTHLFSPIFAVVHLLFNESAYPIERKHVWLCILPPILYFSVSFVLEFFNVDFGRGVPYPYFFMNFRSPAGVFGFTAHPPFFMGTFYWFLLFPVLLFAIAFLCRRLCNRKRSKPLK